MTAVEVPDQIETRSRRGPAPRRRRPWWLWVAAAGLAVAAVTAAIVTGVRQAADARVEVTAGWGGGLPDEVGGVAVDGAPSAYVATPFGSATVVEFRDTIAVERLLSLSHDTDRTVTITDIDGVRARASGRLVDDGGCRLASSDAATWVTSRGELPATARADATPFTADVALRPGETAFVWLTSSFDGATCPTVGTSDVGAGGVLVDHVVRGTEGTSTVELDDLRFVPDLDAFLDGAVEVTRR